MSKSLDKAVLKRFWEDLAMNSLDQKDLETLDNILAKICRIKKIDGFLSENGALGVSYPQETVSGLGSAALTPYGRMVENARELLSIQRQLKESQENIKVLSESVGMIMARMAAEVDIIDCADGEQLAGNAIGKPPVLGERPEGDIAFEYPGLKFSEKIGCNPLKKNLLVVFHHNEKVKLQESNLFPTWQIQNFGEELTGRRFENIIVFKPSLAVIGLEGMARIQKEISQSIRTRLMPDGKFVEV